METMAQLRPRKAVAELPKGGSMVAAFGTTSGRMPKGFKSMRSEPKDDARKHHDKSLKRLLNEVLVIGHRFPFPDSLPKQNCPEWARRVQKEYFRATFPRLDVKNSNELSAMEMGGFLGFQCAYAVWMTESLGAMIDEGTEHTMANPEKSE